MDSILITPPTYGMYEVCANIHDVDIISAPLFVEVPESNPKGLKVSAAALGFGAAIHQRLTSIVLIAQNHLPLPSFHIKPQQILNAVTDNTKIIFLCSPGNPTANCLRFSDIEAILTAKVGSYRLLVCFANGF